MLTEKRLSQVMEIINQEKSVSVKDLCHVLGVSEMTVWRDLKVLETQGLIRRVRGGAVEVKDSTGPNQVKEPQFRLKQKLFSEEKARIARYAAEELVQEGDIIILEGGTTVASMVPHLTQPDLTVLTNGLNTLVMAASRLSNITLLGCGGILRDVSLTFVGPQAISFFSTFRAHKVFIGATGFTLRDGFTDPNPLEIQVKHAMQQSAEKAIMLIDSSKFGKRSLSTTIRIDEVDILVTDSNAPPDVLEEIRALGVDVRVC